MGHASTDHSAFYAQIRKEVAWLKKKIEGPTHSDEKKGDELVDQVSLGQSALQKNHKKSKYGDDQMTDYFKKQALVEEIMQELQESAPLDDQLPQRKRRRR